MTKKTIIRIIVLLLVFIVSFTAASKLMNKNNIDRTSEMAENQLPTVCAFYNGRLINQMFGYTREMQGQYMRDAITPLDGNHKLSIQVQTYEQNIKSIGFEVRSLDAKRLIEDTEVKEWTESEAHTIDVNFNIQDLLSEDTEYLLIIKLATDQYEKICYYTRIIKDINFNTEEKLKFALDFHDKTIKKDESIVKNLESNASGNNSNYYHVDIHSSFAQVTFGEFEFNQIANMQVQLQEINSQTAVMVLRYQAEMTNAAQEIERYSIEEFYRVRYTKDRMYLLEFERTMDELFTETNQVYYAKALSLGISSDSVEYKFNGEGSIVSFVKHGALYCFNSAGNTISRVFGFTGGDDARYHNLDHEIKIVNVDEGGSTDFIVTGYMNSGDHQGESGVAVYHYDSLINGVEEKLFIPSQKPYQLLKEEIGQLAYISGKGILYVNFADCIYAISMESHQSEILVDSKENGGFTVTKDNVWMAWQEASSVFDSQIINLINFNTGKMHQIKVDETQRIKPLGFIGDDFIYGIANVADIQPDAEGKQYFPMYKIVIQNERQKIIKEYEKTGVYVIDGIISDNMINLIRLEKINGVYALTEDDQITHSVAEQDIKGTLASITTDRKKREYQLQFQRELKEREPNCLYPKQIIYEDKDDMELKLKKDKVYYYVYAKGKLDRVCNDAVSAILRADEIAGTVITENQACIFERTKRKAVNQITAFPTVSVNESMDSLTACVTALARFYGVAYDPAQTPVSESNVIETLQNLFGEAQVVNMSGVSLQQALYLVSKDAPVLVKLGAGSYGVLVGFNNLNTIVMNPQQGKTGYIGIEDSKAMYGAAGNVYIGCLK